MTTYTITFGEQSENHKGMQIIGNGLKDEGLTISDLESAQAKFEKLGYKCQLFKLDQFYQGDAEPAAILVVRGGIKAVIDQAEISDYFDEMENLTWDDKAFMYGRVVQKHARHNLCFGEKSQDADFENKMGTIVSFQDVPITNSVRKNLPKFFGEKAINLQAEGNKYFDAKNCGIGYHGDSERRIVIALRLGETMKICYRWYFKGEKQSKTLTTMINGGDLYAMSEKATGWDWKRKNIPTLRHAAGADKFTK